MFLSARCDALSAASEPASTLGSKVRGQASPEHALGLGERGRCVEPDGKSFATIPTAAGGVTRLAYAHARAAGIEIGALLTKAGLTEQQVLDHRVRINVEDQIDFLDRLAKAVDDPFLGFHLAHAADFAS